MRTWIGLFLALMLSVASDRAKAVQVNQKDVCANTQVPKGWVIANKSWSRTRCGQPTTPQGNVWTLYQYNNLPVGTSLTMCAFTSPLPNGWLPGSLQTNPAVCGAQFGDSTSPYNTVTIHYVACTGESVSKCYPSLTQFGVIAALPTSVPIPYGQENASTSLAWFASTSSACVWVETAGANPQLWTCSGTSGNQSWPYAAAGVDQTFVLSPSPTAATPVLSSTTVTGVEGSAPKIAASPKSVAVPSGKSQGSTTISYDLVGSNYRSMCIWVSTNDSPPQLWACGSDLVFAQVWPYVPKGGTSVFWLNPSRTSPSQILATVTVTGH